METIFDKKVTIYNGVTDNKGHNATLAEFLEMGEALKEQIAEIRAATGKERKALKQKIQCAATISGVFEPTRGKENLKEHSGLICIDIDIKEDENTQWNAGSVMDLLRQMDIITYASRSIGGKGVFAFVPLAYPERHEEQFEALYLVFKEKYGIELDTSCKDAPHLRFISYDPEAFWRPDAKVWEGVWSEPKRKPMPKATTAPPGTHNATTPKRPTTIAQVDEEATIARAKVCADELVNRGISLCETNEEWYVMAGALSELGNEGRAIFHQISRLSPKYEVEENDAAFDRAMREERKADIGTFFARCEAHGILWKNLDWRKYQTILPLADFKKLYPGVM